MVIVLKNRAAIYQREAAEMLHNISLYPGLTEGQLCHFFPEKEVTAKTLLAHMLKEERIFCAENGRYYANQEAQNGADKTIPLRLGSTRFYKSGGIPHCWRIPGSDPLFCKWGAV